MASNGDRARRAARARSLVLARQQGQALIFGLFALAGGLVALFFLFNTGQLTAEKTKLVNTADAVAYSAGIMHARALNFDAYTNRALMANEVMIAQAVSMASWTAYVADHSGSAQTLMNCRNQYAVPVGLFLFTYVPACYVLALPPAQALPRRWANPFHPPPKPLLPPQNWPRQHCRQRKSTWLQTCSWRENH